MQIPILVPIPIHAYTYRLIRIRICVRILKCTNPDIYCTSIGTVPSNMVPYPIELRTDPRSRNTYSRTNYFVTKLEV